MATNNSINNKITNNEFSVGNKNANTVGANVNLLKDRDGGAVQSGDVIGEVNFAGHDGTKHLMPCSGIISTTSGTIGTDRVAANLEFFTHADNTDAAKQRMVVSPEGLMTINNPDSGGVALTTPADINANAISFDGGTNTLGIYQYDTWTPTLSFGGGSTGIAYSNRAGFFIRIGRLVTIHFIINLTNKGTSAGAAAVSGAGIPPIPTSRFLGVARTANVSFTSTIMGVMGAAGDITLQRGVSGGSVGDVTNTNFTNDSDVWCSITYIADA